MSKFVMNRAAFDELLADESADPDVKRYAEACWDHLASAEAIRNREIPPEGFKPIPSPAAFGLGAEASLLTLLTVFRVSGLADEQARIEAKIMAARGDA